MKAVTPVAVHQGGRRTVFRTDHPDGTDVPASIDDDGIVMTEWEPSADELDRVLQGGRLRIWIFTDGRPLQALTVEVADPPCGARGT